VSLFADEFWGPLCCVTIVQTHGDRQLELVFRCFCWAENALNSVAKGEFKAQFGSKVPISLCGQQSFRTNSVWDRKGEGFRVLRIFRWPRSP
jgi:hypothetical protein